jgi:hypothetical protein
MNEEWAAISGYDSIIAALKRSGITFADNPFFRVVELLNDQQITNWRDRADIIWCAQQEYRQTQRSNK